MTFVIAVTEWLVLTYALLAAFVVMAIIVTVLIEFSRKDSIVQKRGEKWRAIVNHPDYEWNKLDDRVKASRVAATLNNAPEFAFVAHAFDISVLADHQFAVVHRDGTRIFISDMAKIVLERDPGIPPERRVAHWIFDEHKVLKSTRLGYRREPRREEPEEPEDVGIIVAGKPVNPEDLE